jgi:hypothetical protein
MAECLQSQAIDSKANGPCYKSKVWGYNSSRVTLLTSCERVAVRTSIVMTRQSTSSIRQAACGMILTVVRPVISSSSYSFLRQDTLGTK